MRTAFFLPLSICHSIHRWWDRQFIFRRIIEAVSLREPDLQTRRDAISAAILRHMERTPAWRKYYTDEQMANEAVMFAVQRSQ